ncbi:MAG: hypothetical protein K2P85_01835 [Flavobacteriaceae bacterium]|nr:hypothetical protein [Flavobacteriaceae bacterium]
MGILTIKYGYTIIAQFEVNSLKSAIEYVKSDDVKRNHIAIFSTFNKVGIENTVKILKQ